MRYGCKRITTLVKREQWDVNHMRVYRIHELAGLNLRGKRTKRSRAVAHHEVAPHVTAQNEEWAWISCPVRCSTGGVFPSFRR